MTTVSGHPRVGRDAAVDLVKAVCLLIVVGLHSMMAGVTVGAEGLVVRNALAGHPIFAWATWAVQIMPLFFLLGGFSSLTQWRRMKADGATAGDYIRQRVQRLAHPALLPFVIIGGALAAFALAGTPNEIVRNVGFQIGQPMWFLAVYLGCAGFVPLMSKLHDAAPRLTIFALPTLAILVDTAVQITRIEMIGALNLLFVWLFVQQLGFWYADGFFLRRNRWLMLALAVASFGVLLVLTLVVGYSTDMYENLNPPNLCILVIGLGQLFLFTFLHPWLDKVAQRDVLKRAASAINSHSMTIYLWHVPVVVLVALTTMTVRLPLPEPLSQDWWETRPLFLAAIAVGLIPVVWLVAYYDKSRRWETPPPTTPLVAAIKVITAVAGVVVILVLGFSSLPAVGIALALLIVAVYLQSSRKKPQQPKPLETQSLEGDELGAEGERAADVAGGTPDAAPGPRG